MARGHPSVRPMSSSRDVAADRRRGAPGMRTFTLDARRSRPRPPPADRPPASPTAARPGRGSPPSSPMVHDPARCPALPPRWRWRRVTGPSGGASTGSSSRLRSWSMRWWGRRRRPTSGPGRTRSRDLGDPPPPPRTDPGVPRPASTLSRCPPHPARRSTAPRRAVRVAPLRTRSHPGPASGPGAAPILHPRADGSGRQRSSPAETTSESRRTGLRAGRGSSPTPTLATRRRSKATPRDPVVGGGRVRTTARPLPRRLTAPGGPRPWARSPTPPPVTATPSPSPPATPWRATVCVPLRPPVGLTVAGWGDGLLVAAAGPGGTALAIARPTASTTSPTPPSRQRWTAWWEATPPERVGSRVGGGHAGVLHGDAEVLGPGGGGHGVADADDRVLVQDSRAWSKDCMPWYSPSRMRASMVASSAPAAMASAIFWVPIRISTAGTRPRPSTRSSSRWATTPRSTWAIE